MFIVLMITLNVTIDVQVTCLLVMYNFFEVTIFETKKSYQKKLIESNISDKSLLNTENESLANWDMIGISNYVATN